MYRVNQPKLAVTAIHGIPNSGHVSKMGPKTSINWTIGSSKPEILSTDTGKTTGGQISRLAKRSFFRRFLKIYGQLFDSAPKPPFYGAFKNNAISYKKAQKALEKAFIAAGLGKKTA